MGSSSKSVKVRKGKRSRVLIRVGTVADLTLRQYNECRAATLGSTGLMQSELQRIRKKPKIRNAVVRIVTPKYELVGWALLHISRNRKNVDSHFFVKKKFRNRGFGRRLYSICSKLNREVLGARTFFGFRHDKVSGEFFKHLGHRNPVHF